MRNVAFVLAGLLSIVPSVCASVPESAVVVTDPTGDALAAGAAPSPSHEWADVVRAEIEETSPEAFTLRLFVAATGPAFADGVVMLNFLVDDQWFFLGYGALVFPGGRYEGAFYCPSDEYGTPTGECPNLPGGSYGAGVFVVPDVPRAAFGLEAPGATMERPWLESGNHVLAMHWLRADRSDEGAPFVFSSEQVSPTDVAESEKVLDETTVEPNGGQDGARPRQGPDGSAPGVGFLALVVLLGATALRRRT